MQQLETELAQLINRYSLGEILIALRNLCKIAHENNPGFHWDRDTAALTGAIERINN